jgi:hypothetical protein
VCAPESCVAARLPFLCRTPASTPIACIRHIPCTTRSAPLTTDEAMGMLVRRFPAVVSIEIKGYGETASLTDEGLRAVIK